MAAASLDAGHGPAITVGIALNTYAPHPMIAPPAAERARAPALDAAVSTLEVPGLGHPNGMFVMADGNRLVSTSKHTLQPVGNQISHLPADNAQHSSPPPRDAREVLYGLPRLGIGVDVMGVFHRVHPYVNDDVSYHSQHHTCKQQEPPSASRPFRTCAGACAWSG